MQIGLLNSCFRAPFGEFASGLGILHILFLCIANTIYKNEHDFLLKIRKKVNRSAELQIF